MLYYIMLYYIILYYIILYYTMLYYIMLYYIILYYTMLCYIMLYYIILYYTISETIAHVDAIDSCVDVIDDVVEGVSSDPRMCETKGVCETSNRSQVIQLPVFTIILVDSTKFRYVEVLCYVGERMTFNWSDHTALGLLERLRASIFLAALRVCLLRARTRWQKGIQCLHKIGGKCGGIYRVLSALVSLSDGLLPVRFILFKATRPTALSSVPDIITSSTSSSPDDICSSMIRSPMTSLLATPDRSKLLLINLYCGVNGCLFGNRLAVTCMQIAPDSVMTLTVNWVIVSTTIFDPAVGVVSIALRVAAAVVSSPPGTIDSIIFAEPTSTTAATAPGTEGIRRVQLQTLVRPWSTADDCGSTAII